MTKINVTKTFLPPRKEYEKYIEKIWDSGQLTNQGQLLTDLESLLKKHLSLDDIHMVTNGTIALQVALRALGISSGEIITTPFSYVATTSAILWEGCSPIYVDIDPKTLCIDASKIEAAITDETKAILAVHVFGNPCDIEAIQEVAERHNVKVIYDAAHAFGAGYKGRSLLNYGDISICSFHSTKRFHTIEGGCLIAKNKDINDKIELIKRFGHNGDEHFMLGTNAKASEFQAAMGLCNLKYFDANTQKRKKITEKYDELLDGKFKKPKFVKETKLNYAYYPIIFESKDKLNVSIEKLEAKNVYPRRYFYPSLNTLPYIENQQNCPISEDISNRILCLPLYEDLSEKDIERICEIINS